MLTTVIMAHSRPTGSSMSRRSSIRARVAEKSSSCIFVNSTPWKKTKGSGVQVLGAERRACAVCDHNGRTDP